MQPRLDYFMIYYLVIDVASSREINQLNASAKTTVFILPKDWCLIGWLPRAIGKPYDRTKSQGHEMETKRLRDSRKCRRYALNTLLKQEKLESKCFLS